MILIFAVLEREWMWLERDVMQEGDATNCSGTQRLKIQYRRSDHDKPPSKTKQAILCFFQAGKLCANLAREVRGAESLACNQTLANF
jgi:hypothetical protein